MALFNCASFVSTLSIQVLVVGSIALIAILPPASIATAKSIPRKECSSPAGSWSFSSQREANDTLQDCTVLNSDVKINSDYAEGSFALPNVSSIKGLYASQTRSLSSLSFERLENATTLHLDQTQIQTLHLPVRLLDDIWIRAALAMDVQLDGILSLNTMTLLGSFSSVSMAHLREVHGPFLSAESNLDDSMGAELQFSSLGHLEEFDIRGNISYIDMPVLGVVSGKFHVATTSKSMLVALPTLTNATYLDLEGGVYTLRIPSLHFLSGQLNINSTVFLNCSIIEAQYDQTVQAPPPQSVTNPPSEWTTRAFHCQEKKPKKCRNCLSNGAKLGVGLSVGIVAVIAIPIACWMLWDKKKRYVREKKELNKDSTAIGGR